MPDVDTSEKTSPVDIPQNEDAADETVPEETPNGVAADETVPEETPIGVAADETVPEETPNGVTTDAENEPAESEDESGSESSSDDNKSAVEQSENGRSSVEVETDNTDETPDQETFDPSSVPTGVDGVTYDARPTVKRFRDSAGKFTAAPLDKDGRPIDPVDLLTSHLDKMKL